MIATRSGDRIAVSCNFRDNAIVGALPAASWSRAQRAWLFPATRAAARSLLRVLPSPLPALADLAGEDALPAREDALPFPDTTYPPMRHQLRGAHWLADREAALLRFGLGTGKTRAALDALRLVGARRILVVCPLSVAPVWPLQSAIHAGEYFKVVTLTDGGTALRSKRLAKLLAETDADQPLIVVLNYDGMWREPIAARLLGQRWDAVIYDEIHAIKSAGSRRSVFASRLRTSAARSWGLSGTPLTQSPLDAYGVFRALDPGIFGTNFRAFENRYAVLGGFQGRQVIGYRNQQQFREQFFSITLDQDRSVLDLPPITDVEVPIILPPEARVMYASLKSQYIARHADGSETTAVHALTRLLRLQQMTSGSVPADETQALREVHREKELALTELLSDLDPQDPAVVFCRFSADIERVHRAAISNGRGSRELSGRVNQLAEWQASSAPGEVLAVQVQSGSEGIDLTRAAHVFYFSVPLSLAQYDQSRARVHRPGQERPVTYFHLIAQATVDRYIYRLLKNRRDVIDSVLKEGLRDE